jgi:hypothetical protein
LSHAHLAELKRIRPLLRMLVDQLEAEPVSPAA